jgi:hypothetical protein
MKMDSNIYSPDDSDDLKIMIVCHNNKKTEIRYY